MYPLEKIRKKLGLTQRQLSEAIDCCQQNISHIERGRQVLLPHLAKRIVLLSESLGRPVDFNEIYGGISEERPRFHRT